ncbi:peptide ABC transporter substrate-binding protein [Bombilactobacillus folatiphilus]|uniref:Peptide ABC transporter substrate-binding protein n=1 Tax=Bombilactobacillus folatiphilus TaxID=2923362 RepID=A0ABY4P7T9_9LACO|nr:peptide ABC transporter substrate-binding protein [Bombilactobacillus folatiphilus]UQS81778.1 peptide ABC transporter substrate-binding protein [Bombilactobacillus folatiphilus]
MKRIYLIGLTIITSLGLAGCGHNNATNNKEISIGASAELSTADVSLAMDNESAEVAEQVNEGLYNFNKKGDIIPALATGKPKLSNDQTTYTINMRHNGQWSNGKPVTAKDFVYGWQRTVDPKTKSQQSYFLENVQNYKAVNDGKMAPSNLGIKATGKYQLQIKLDHAVPYFPSVLAMSASFPLYKPYVQAQGKKYGTSAQHTLYNGPFVLKNWDGTSDTWSYVKNPHYWDKKHVHLNKIKVSVIKSQDTGAYQFESKELAMVPLTGQEIKNHAKSKSLYVRKLPGTMYLEFNTKRKLFSNEKIRQAMSMAMDRKQLTNNVLQDKSVPATGFVPTGFSNPQTGKDFAKEAGQLNQYDTKQAKQLWQSGLSELGMKSANFTILSSNDDQTKKVDEFIQSQLQTHLPGLKVSVKAVPFNSRLSSSESGNYDAVINGWTPTFNDPSDFLNLVKTGNKNNEGKFSDPQYDQLLDQANGQYSTQPAQRWNALQEANKLVVQKAPVVPMYYISLVYLINPKLKGVVMGPMGFPYYKNASMN